MQNRVTVAIAGKDYTILGEESPSYTQKVAAHVDAQIKEIMSTTKVSLTDAAILAGLNITDQLFKEQESADGLRRQLKEYLEEANRAKLELSEAKRENFKLQNQLQNRRS